MAINVPTTTTYMDESQQAQPVNPVEPWIPGDSGVNPYLNLSPFGSEERRKRLAEQEKQRRIAEDPAYAKKLGLNVLGQKLLNYEGITDKEGQVSSPFSMLQQPVSKYEQMLSKQALSEGLSPQEQYELNQQLDTARQGSLGLQAQNEEQLASLGGLGGGARERLAASGAEQLALQSQGIRGNIGSQSLQNKLGLLQGLAGTQSARGQSDIEAARTDQAGRQQFGLSQFTEEARAIAAMKSAKEQAKAANSGGGGGFLGIF